MRVLLILALCSVPAMAQQPLDPTKIETWLADQRNRAQNDFAACAAEVNVVRNRLAELEKQLAAKVETKEPPAADK